MAYNATIASQISRISLARDVLKAKGIALGLNVPAGSYWDDNLDKEVATSATALLKTSDQIDKIAAAFNTMPTKVGEIIPVPIKISTDGKVTVAEGTTLDAGFYLGTKITPYVEVETDVVLNVEEIKNRTLSTKSGTIIPSEGYNYISSVGYVVKTGAIQTSAVDFGNNFVTVQASESGWIDTTDASVKVSVTQSAMTKKVGSDSASALNSGDSIAPSETENTTITISSGIYGSDRTIIIDSVKSKTPGDAGVNDILSGKVAWVNGTKVTGEMTNFSNESTEADSLVNNSGKLAIKPSETGYYNNTTTITTDIVYNPVRVFNTTSITTAGTDTMTSQTYYETIPKGYYAAPITRTITVQDAVGAMSVDYTTHKVHLNVSKAGWIDEGDVADVTINAGAATYSAKLEDPTQYVVAAESNAYLTQVTIDNSEIYKALSAI